MFPLLLWTLIKKTKNKLKYPQPNLLNRPPLYLDQCQTISMTHPHTIVLGTPSLHPHVILPDTPHINFLSTHHNKVYKEQLKPFDLKQPHPTLGNTVIKDGKELIYSYLKSPENQQDVTGIKICRDVVMKFFLLCVTSTWFLSLQKHWFNDLQDVQKHYDCFLEKTGPFFWKK